MKYLRLLACSYVASVSLLCADERDPEVQILQPGVRFTLIAEHPELATPTGIDVDGQRKVWLVASHTHFPPEGYDGPKFDEILVFDQHGNRSVFYNATHHTMDLELGPDGWVYLAERDRILRVKDTDGDGKGDLEEELAALESDAVYPHNGLSGLAWDINGDLLFGLGENFSHPWTLTGTDKTTFQGTGEGGIFRCRSDGSKLRRVARGLWNPFGICVREDGAVFAVDNDPGERPPCRLLHIVEDGDYGYQRAYGPEAHHPFVCWNGELRGTLPMIHPSGEAPSGVTPFGRGVFVTSWSDHRIYFYKLRPKGASFDAERVELVRGSRYFRPTCIAPERTASNDEVRTWYLTDWVDGRYELHGYGRLWKLEIELREAKWVGPTELETPTERAQLAVDLRKANQEFSQQELFEFAGDDDPFVAHAALSALARTTDQWSCEFVQSLPANDRANAVVALKLATTNNRESENSSDSMEPWIQWFIVEKSPEVQFEALRWIAESQQIQFLPDVEQLLKRSDLNYKLFEASIATWNILSGQAELGVRNVPMLLERVRDPASSPSLRAFALRLLPNLPLTASDEEDVALEYPEGLSVELLQELLDVGDAALSLEAVCVLAGNPEAGQELLAELADDTERPEQLRAEAIAGLAAVSLSHRALLLKLAGDSQQAVRNEAIRSLRGNTLTLEQKEKLREIGSNFPKSADLVRAIIEPSSLSDGRPEPTDTNAWLDRIAAIPGAPDVESGRRIFHHTRIATCSRCHRHNGRGSVVGPDLSVVGAQRDRSWLLKSILQPGREMAPQYRPTSIVLNDGRSFTGIRLRSATFEVLRDSNGQNRRFDRLEIETIRELDQSFMPDGLVYMLTDRELRDLIVFLEPPSER